MRERVDAPENEPPPLPPIRALLVVALPMTFTPLVSRYLHHHVGPGASMGLMVLYFWLGALVVFFGFRIFWRGRRLDPQSGRRVGLAITLLFVLSIAAEVLSVWIDHHL